MFDSFKNLGALPGLLAKAGEMQKRVKELQEEMGRRQFTADAGGGRVTAIVNGRLEVLKVRINPASTDMTQIDLLEDLIVAAVNAAQNNAATTMRDEMQKITSEMGIPPGMLPGM